jgi:hypothetical protein
LDYVLIALSLLFLRPAIAQSNPPKKKKGELTVCVEILSLSEMQKEMLLFFPADFHSAGPTPTPKEGLDVKVRTSKRQREIMERKVAQFAGERIIEKDENWLSWKKVAGHFSEKERAEILHDQIVVGVLRDKDHERGLVVRTFIGVIIGYEPWNAKSMQITEFNGDILTIDPGLVNPILRMDSI